MSSSKVKRVLVSLGNRIREVAFSPEETDEAALDRAIRWVFRDLGF